jgi:hypothetical protein
LRDGEHHNDRPESPDVPQSWRCGGRGEWCRTGPGGTTRRLRRSQSGDISG